MVAGCRFYHRPQWAYYSFRMRKCLLVNCLVLFCCANSYAQTPPAPKVTGRVLDATTGNPVAFASAVLLHLPDSSVVTGMYTGEDGRFAFEKITPATYVVRITFMGYQKLEKAVKVVTGKNTGTGPLRLQSVGQHLSGVEIKGEKPAFSMQIDRQVFDAGSFITAEGGTGTDILKNIPSVDVDIDDNVTLRGKSVTIFVDGKPSPFGDAKTALQMLPAETIDRVEVITNPSAKFDAQGGGGIINIVLKKDKAIGYHVMLNAGVASRGQVNGSANASLRLRKFNFFGSYNGRYERLNGSGYSYRQNLRADTAGTWFFSQDSRNRNRSGSQGGRFGVDFYMDDKNTITLAQGINHSTGHNEETIFLNYLGRDHQPLRTGNRNNDSRNNSYNYNTSLSYKHTYDKPNQELTAYISYSYNNSRSNSDYRTLTEKPGSTPAQPGWQSNTGDNGNRFWNIQSDYTSPMGKKGKLEAGVKATLRHIANDYTAMLFDYTSGQLEKSDRLSNTYTYDEDIAGAYINFANAAGNLGYQVGLRAEQSFLKGYSVTKDTTVNNRFFNLFPSIFLKYNLPKHPHQSLVFNYGTRVDRPGFDQLLPYINNADPQNIRTGNPELQPALTHKFELNYAVFYPKSNNFLNTGVYYSRTNDDIDRISILDTATGVTTTRPMNLATDQDWGGTVTYRLRLRKWWTATATFNLEYSRLTSMVVNNENFGYGLNANTSFRLPAGFSVQLSGHYRSPRIQPQGTFRAMNGMDLGIRKEMMKDKKLVIALNISDILNTQQYNSHYETPLFIQDYDRKRATRFVRINVRYRFGKMDPNLFKKKKKQEEEEQDETPAAPVKPGGTERL